MQTMYQVLFIFKDILIRGGYVYNVIRSKYTYNGTDILKNKLDIVDKRKLRSYEKKIVALKLVAINFEDFGNKYDEERLKKIHRYLFEDIYYFAGEYRQENIEKENFRFSEYEYIEENIKKIMKCVNLVELREYSFDELVSKISYIMTELNVLHPFREGNGRAIREFIRQLCNELGYKLDWYRIPYKIILEASKAAVLDDSIQVELLKSSMKYITRK